MENTYITEERHKGRKRKGRGLRQEVSKARGPGKRSEVREGNSTSTGKSRAEEKNVGERVRAVTGRAKRRGGACHQMRMGKARMAYTESGQRGFPATMGMARMGPWRNRGFNCTELIGGKTGPGRLPAIIKEGPKCRVVVLSGDQRD